MPIHAGNHLTQHWEMLNTEARQHPRGFLQLSIPAGSRHTPMPSGAEARNDPLALPRCSFATLTGTVGAAEAFLLHRSHQRGRKRESSR